MSLLHRARVQAPDLLHRQDKDSDISQDVWNRIANERSFEVDAVTWDGGIPRSLYRCALKDRDHNDRDAPRNRQCGEDISANFNAAYWEDPKIHQE